MNPERIRRLHATHPAKADPETCWYCGRERAKCKRKLWYANAREAELASLGLGRPTAAYECPWCDGYHVTTNTPTTHDHEGATG